MMEGVETAREMVQWATYYRRLLNRLMSEQGVSNNRHFRRRIDFERFRIRTLLFAQPPLTEKNSPMQQFLTTWHQAATTTVGLF